MASAWGQDARRRPFARCRLDRLVFSIGFMLAGIVLLWIEPLKSPEALTWIGISLFLAGSSTLASVWGSDDEESAA